MSEEAMNALLRRIEALERGELGKLNAARVVEMFEGVSAKVAALEERWRAEAMEVKAHIDAVEDRCTALEGKKRK